MIVLAGGLTSYSTNFDATENPISESAVWTRAANAFTDVRTTGGYACGTMSGSGYDDSYAYIQNWAGGNNFEMEGVVFLSPSIAAVNHEIEFHRFAGDSTSGAQSEEVLFNRLGGVQSVRWDGAPGDVPDYFHPRSLDSGGDAPRALQDGDVLKVRFLGTAITLFFNGSQIATATATYSTGKPGIAFFHSGGNSLHLGLKSLTVTAI